MADPDQTTPAGRRAPYRVRTRPTWRMAGHVLTAIILLVSCAGFVAGGLAGEPGAGAVAFVALGTVGIVLFGGGLLLAAGDLFGRRTVLELDAEGVRRPARGPLPRRYDRALPWSEVTAVAALSRGAGARSRGAQDYLVFVSGAQAVESLRTAPRPQLVALALGDVPADVATRRWPLTVGLRCAVDPHWDATLKEIITEVRRHTPAPVIDRRDD